MGTVGTVYWITGLAGAGKTTIAQLLFKQIKAKEPASVYLDGDRLREVFGQTQNFDSTSRKGLAMQYARLCGLLASQDINVVCATISMFHDVRNWNRSNLRHYKEIYLQVPMEILIERDQKGLYTNALSGGTTSVVGLTESVELPLSPDLEICNDGSRTPEMIVNHILGKITPWESMLSD